MQRPVLPVQMDSRHDARKAEGKQRSLAAEKRVSVFLVGDFRARQGFDNHHRPGFGK